jgi:hypothetical protein
MTPNPVRRRLPRLPLALTAAGAMLALFHLPFTTGCVPLEGRVRALERGEADEEEIARALDAAEPSLRCAAARACIPSAVPDCTAKLVQMARSDDDGAVAACAIASLSRDCGTEARRALADLAIDPDRRFAQPPLAPALSEAVEACPSADAVVAAADRGLWRPDDGRKIPAPSELEARLAWLRAVVSLPAPRTRTGQELESVETEVARRRKEEARRREARRQRNLSLEPSRREAEAARLLRQAIVDSAAILDPDEKIPAPPHPRWGRFAEWSAAPANRKLVDSLRSIYRQRAALRATIDEHAQVKDNNDAQVEEPGAWPVAIFPEVTGAFAFIKILDRAAGEALFSASDGLFVLRLSHGDSFQAFPGQPVYLTMHSRGETMLMTNGKRFPVFLSGHSPTRTRYTPGFQPNRSHEKALARKAKTLETSLAKSLRALVLEEADGEQVYRVRRPPAGVVVAIAADAQGEILEEIRIGDERSPSVFCIADTVLKCDGAREFVDFEASAADGPAPASQALPLPRATVFAADDRLAPLLEQPVLVSEEEAAPRLECLTIDELRPEMRGSTVRNAWYLRTVCGQPLENEAAALRRVRIRAAEGLELRCHGGSGEWGEWKTAAEGCSTEAGLAGFEIRSTWTGSDEDPTIVEVQCHRDGMLPESCEPGASPITAMTVILRTRTPGAAVLEPGEAERPATETATR